MVGFSTIMKNMQVSSYAHLNYPVFNVSGLTIYGVKLSGWTIYGI